MNNRFRRVAVMGSGTMGSQVAAHCANLNIPVLLFDVDSALLRDALRRLTALKPFPLALTAITERISTVTYDDLDRLAECDLVIEAIVEDIEVKKQFFTRIAPHLHADAVVATNTSGLSVNAIARQLPPLLQQRFCGVHFFNPPRYMQLVELIPAEGTASAVLEKLEYFVTASLGKEVVYAHDSPGFIANRLGIFAMVAAFHHAEQLGIAADAVDALTGKLLGRPPSATFRTADVVGLDVLKNVVHTIADNCEDDPWRGYLRLPDWIERLIAQNALGQKSGRGIYHKRDGVIHVYDPIQEDYRPQQKEVEKEVETLVRQRQLPGSLPKLKAMKSKQAQFLWRIHRDTMHYAAVHLPAIARSVRDVDRALSAGFGWKLGIFEIWQEAGWREIGTLISDDIRAGRAMVGADLPAWTARRSHVYEGNRAYAPMDDSMVAYSTHPVYQRQLFPARRLGEEKITGTALTESENVRLIDLGDNVAAVSFLSKLGSIGAGVLSDMDEVLDYLEANGYWALIFWQPGAGAFCAGANLLEVLVGCKTGRLYDCGGVGSKIKMQALKAFHRKLPDMSDVPPVVQMVEKGQDLMMRLKHGPLFTVAAVDGMALGGGCELVLHCNHAVTTMEAYLGLVEVGVGVLPAFGGCKEMILRAQSRVEEGRVSTTLAARHFEQIARGQVATSALEAKKMGYLRADASLIANRSELLYVAKKEALARCEQAGYPVPQDAPIAVMGSTGKANFLAQLANFRAGHFLSDHDHAIASRVADIFSGGVDAPSTVSARWLLEREKNLFMELLETNKTQDRIEHMLKSGKPLRN